MDRSTRFLSLSGSSGIFAGAVAIAGAAAGRVHYAAIGSQDRIARLQEGGPAMLDPAYADHVGFLLADALVVLFVALLGAWWFTRRRAGRTGQSLWDASARRLLINMAIPLATGGLFSFALFRHNDAFLVAPATLVFYGTALLNASKYTLDEVRWLGAIEIALGLIACYWPEAALLLWTIGFGLLHIVYGLLMYLRYERK